MDLGQYAGLSPQEISCHLNNTKLDFLITTGREMLNWPYRTEMNIRVLQTQLTEINTLTRLIFTTIDLSSILVPKEQAQACVALVDSLAIRVVDISNWIQEIEAYETECREDW